MYSRALFAATAAAVAISLSLGLSTSASAQAGPPMSTVPASGSFIGLGGGFSSVDFGTPDVYGFASSNVYKGGTLTSTGSAGGPGTIEMPALNTFSPSVQLGYFQHLSDSQWLWGGKLSYDYYGATSTVQNVLLPQSGSTTSVGSSTPVPFTGNAVTRSYETNITHQIMLTPIVGRSFQNSFVYFGAGPTLSEVKTTQNGVIGFADVTGAPSDISGLPQNFSHSAWVFGGAAMVGATYFFDPAWFADIRYMYAMTAKPTFNYPATFTNPNGVSGTTIAGSGYTTTSGRVITQGVAITINRMF
jgi:opacity protein-like surface antigen